MNLNAILLGVAALLLASKTKGSEQPKKTTTNVFFNPVRSPFGNRIHPINKTKSFHNGIDLRAKENTPIQALRGGYVIQVGKSPKGGNFMLVRLNDDYTMGFAHLNKAVLKEKQKFKAGQLLAYTGNTGLSTAPHLHLTVRNPQNDLIDPVKYLAKYQ